MDNINQAPAPDCGLERNNTTPGKFDGYCGGRAPQAPVVTYAPGSAISIVFKKNFQHPNNSFLSTGFYVFLLSSPDPSATRHPLLVFNDTPSASLTLYVKTVTIPADVNYPNAVLQLIYDAPYGDTDYVYYQCADVSVVPKPSPPPVPVIPNS